MGSFTQNLGATYNGSDPRKLSAAQRAYIQNYGDWMNQQAQQQAGYAQGQGQYYEEGLQNALGPMVQGQGGYNPIEQGQIMGLYGQGGVPGLTDLPTPQEALQSNYLTGDEQQAIAGNPNYSGYFDPASMDASQNESAGFQRGAVQGLQSGLNSAIDPNALRQSQSYLDATGQTLASNRGNTMATLGGEAGNVRGALGGETSAVRGAIDPNMLRQSASAAKQIQMTPEQQQDIVTGAGISAGIRNQAAVGDLQRQTAAAGGSPQAVAAYRERMGRESAAEAGDAMTQARIAASNAAAERALQSEQQRLGGEQYLTGQKTGTELALGQQQTGSELNLGQQAMQAQQALGAQQLAQQNAQEQQRLGAQQYLTGANMQAATVGGEAAIGNEQAINAQQRQQQQFNTQAGTGILQAQDQAAAQRAAQLAANRQGVNQYNQQTQYNQGLTANQLASQRAAQVAGTRLGQQQFGIGQYGNLQNQKNQNQQNAYNRQQQTFGTTVSGTNQATGYGLQASQTPTKTEKVIGGVIGAAGPIAGAIGGAADGDVFTQPTVKMIAEGGQPEWVGPALQGAAAGMGMKPNVYSKGGAAIGGLIGNYLNHRHKKQMEQSGNEAESDAVNSAIDMPGNTLDQMKAPQAPSVPDYMSEGEVVTKPTLAVLAEHGEPEAVVPLTKRPDAKMRPGVVMGREAMRKRPPMYG